MKNYYGKMAIDVAMQSCIYRKMYSKLNQYWGYPTIANSNALEISLTNLAVDAGANQVARPVANGVVSGRDCRRSR